MRNILKGIGSQKGFTLIELLVVIGILAAVAGVVTIAVTQFIGRGTIEACHTDLHNVQTAVTACMVEEETGDASGLCDTSALLIDGDPAYLLQAPLGTYSVASNGVVTQDSCPVRDANDQPAGVISPGS